MMVIFHVLLLRPCWNCLQRAQVALSKRHFDLLRYDSRKNQESVRI